MRKFSSSQPYRPSFNQKSAGAVKKFIMDIMMDATDQLVDINPVAEDIADQIFDLSMYSPSPNEIFELIDDLAVPMSDKIQMKAVIKEAFNKFDGSKFASNKQSFQNISSFYKTQPARDFELYDDMGGDMYAEDMESFDEYSEEEYSGDDYLYNQDGSLYEGFPEDDFSSEMMADDLYAGRRWDGKGNQKDYNKPPALDNSGCYAKKDWKGKKTPGQGTCYRLHNEYGEANAGKPGTKERAEYNRKYRAEWMDSKSKKRTGPLPGSKRWK